MRKSVTALECTQNKKKFYIATMESNDLKDMCFVSRRKEEPIKGFQRLLNKKRVKSIATYLDDEKGVIPSAIILSAQDNAKIRYEAKTQKISFEKCAESMLVIDGQHRLYGLFDANNTYEIPVIIFEGLTSSEEVRLFIDINTTQKGVPSALILDIKSQAGTETKLEERQRNLFDQLDSDSVLSGYLLRNESKAGKISRTVFNGSTKAIFETGPVSNSNDKIIYMTVKNYLEAVDYVFKLSGSTNARINKTILFKAVMSIFNDVCEKCLIKYKDLKVESLKDYLDPLKELNYDEYTGTNKATESKIIGDMKNTLKEPVVVDEDMF